jgi:hypothetical protein
MAANVTPVAVWFGPIFTGGIISALFAKNVEAPLAAFALFWYIATFLALYVQAVPVILIQFLAYPLAVFILGEALGIVISQIGVYPRLFDFFHLARTAAEASVRPFDKRRVVWEGLVIVLSAWAIYFGAFLIAGDLNNACLGADPATATAVGWVLLALGVVGVLVVAAVTVFDNTPTNFERRIMWKYLLAAAVIIAAVALANNLTYIINGLVVFYGLIGLAVALVGWILFGLWAYYVSFVSEKSVRDGIKGVYEESIVERVIENATLDGFMMVRRLVIFTVTAGLANVLGYTAIWLTAIFTSDPLWPFVAAAAFTALAIIIIVVLALTTNLYYTARRRVDIE